MSETPSSVFWIRRAVVLVALFTIIGLLGFGVNAVFKATNTADPAEQQTDSTEDVEAAEPEEVEISECMPGTVVVTAEIGNADGEDKRNFNPSEMPYLWYTLTNNSSEDCFFNVGTAVTFFEITSGEELYWTSRDCFRGDTFNENRLLEPGVTLRSEPSPWEKVRSSEDCSGPGLEDVPTLGASYWLSVEVNGVFSDEDSDPQFLLY